MDPFRNFRYIRVIICVASLCSLLLIDLEQYPQSFVIFYLLLRKLNLASLLTPLSFKCLNIHDSYFCQFFSDFETHMLTFGQISHNFFTFAHNDLFNSNFIA
jgi:hypothetical protein